MSMEKLKSICRMTKRAIIIFAGILTLLYMVLYFICMPDHRSVRPEYAEESGHSLISDLNFSQVLYYQTIGNSTYANKLVDLETIYEGPFEIMEKAGITFHFYNSSSTGYMYSVENEVWAQQVHTKEDNPHIVPMEEMIRYDIESKKYNRAGQANNIEKGEEFGIGESKHVRALIITNYGDIEVQLFSKEAPEAVAKFIDLVTGENSFIDLRTKTQARKKYYNGSEIYRVLPNRIIQFGEPLGLIALRSKKNERYETKDRKGSLWIPRIRNSTTRLPYPVKGIVAFNNTDPYTNAAQILILLRTTDCLALPYQYIGKVVNGMDVAEKISHAPTDERLKPMDPIIIKEIKIKRQ